MEKSAAYYAVVEDNPDHFEIIKRFLRRNNPACQIRWLKNGAEALDYFNRMETDDEQEEAMPDVVLLDLRLPGVSGLEILRRIKLSQRTKGLIVIVLSSSQHPKDIAAAYGSYANSYVIKPSSLEDLSRLFALINQYWIETNYSFSRASRGGTAT